MTSQSSLYISIAIARITLGFIFLWGFFDKLLGLGFATCRDTATGAIDVLCQDAWINGSSPTAGFLQFGTAGPLQSAFQSLTGNMVVDWLFMLGLLLIGLSLMLGIGVKVATISGSILMLTLWMSMMLPANNPIVDEHIIYILVLAIVFFSNDSQRLGFGPWWQRQSVAQKHPQLQ